MSIQQQIEDYITNQPVEKRNDMIVLDQLIQKVLPEGKLWFLNGKNSEGKIVSNPNIGYGLYNIKYADGTSKIFYQIGMSANTTGISIYILGIEDKNYLVQNFGDKLGKASVTGYCIKFKKLKDINLSVLEEAIRDGIKISNEH